MGININLKRKIMECMKGKNIKLKVLSKSADINFWFLIYLIVFPFSRLTLTQGLSISKVLKVKDDCLLLKEILDEFTKLCYDQKNLSETLKKIKELEEVYVGTNDWLTVKQEVSEEDFEDLDLSNFKY